MIYMLGSFEFTPKMLLHLESRKQEHLFHLLGPEYYHVPAFVL